MARTPFLKPEEMTPEQRRVYDHVVASRGKWIDGPFAPMLQQPRMAAPAAELGEFLRYHTSLGPPLSELAIIVVARHWDCEFEWSQHARIARASGVASDIVDAVARDARPASLDERQTTVYEFARALLEQHQVPDVLYDKARELFGVVGVVELTGLIGYYTFIAFALNAHQVPLPAGTVPALMPRQVLPEYSR
jgi:4-carboxymuconolactone decarboxylase